MANSLHNEHSHHHHHSATRGAFMRLVTTVILYLGINLISGMIPNPTMRFILYFCVYLYVGFDVLVNAIKGVIHGEFFDENFLMTVATLGVFALALFSGTEDYNEAIAVLMFFQIGEYFQGYASRKSIEKIQEMGYDMKDFGESKSEAFITRFAKIYTPFVCFGAIALAILPPLFNSILGSDAQWSIWIYRALTFLVISCPCAMVISIPMTFFASIIGASKKGILITDGCCLETLNKGTFPKGNIVFTDNNPEKIETVKRIARKCMNIVWQNIIFAVGVKIIVLILSAFGITSMWLAVFADTGIMILAVLNAMRALYIK